MLRVVFNNELPHLFKNIRKIKAANKRVQVAVSTYDVSQFMKQNGLSVKDIYGLL